MKNQHPFQILGKTYHLHEPMTTDCGLMFIRLQGILLPAIGAAETGYKDLFKTLFQALTPAEFVDITQTLVSWCRDDKDVELVYNTEFRGPDGLRRLVKLCEAVIKALYWEVFQDVQKGVMEQYKAVKKEQMKALQKIAEELAHEASPVKA